MHMENSQILYPNRLDELFARQEQEDWNRLVREVKTEIIREFSNSEAVIEKLQKYADINQEKQWEQFLKYNQQHWRRFLKFSIEQTWIRTETQFSIRKHTTCQIPYYHSHDFYEYYLYFGFAGNQYPFSRLYSACWKKVWKRGFIKT